MTTSHYFRRRRPLPFKTTPKCAVCGKTLHGGYKKVGGKPRCYWCCKRLGNV